MNTGDFLNELDISPSSPFPFDLPTKMVSTITVKMPPAPGDTDSPATLILSSVTNGANREITVHVEGSLPTQHEYDAAIDLIKAFV